MRDKRVLLVSVKPAYAELLLSGVKTVELRRVRPNVELGALVLIYASSPAMEMVGTAKVDAVSSGALDDIWDHHASATGITRTAYDSYFAGRDTAVAIRLVEVRRLQRGVPLAELRQRVSGFRPPQSFRYLQRSQALAII